MKKKILQVLLLILITGLLTTYSAHAQLLTDNFDSYINGSQMHGQGGWKGWDNNPAWGALVTNALSYSPPNSVEIVGASDLVHEFSGASSGPWVVAIMDYPQS